MSSEFSADPKKNKPYSSTSSESELDLSDISEMATQQTSSETAATGTATDSSQPQITIPPSEMAKISGPGCSKLMTSLVNVSLNFQKLISQMCQYFLLKKCEKLLHCKSYFHFFSTKTFSVFDYKNVKHLTS